MPALGADDAVLVTDHYLCWCRYVADYTIASAIRHILEPVIPTHFCGKQAIDGDTAQVGPQIAENSVLKQTAYACQDFP